jgi:TonB family protein
MPMRRLLVPILAIGVLCPFVVSVRAEAETGKVVKVTADDTLVVKIGHEKRVVCLVGVVGREESSLTRRLAIGRQVSLWEEFDTRYLAPPHCLSRYAFLEDGTLLNAEVIKQGYGFADRSPFARSNEFARYELEAMKARRGLWQSGSKFEAVPEHPDPSIVESDAEGVTPPVLIPGSRVQPEYPGEDRKASHQGRLYLRAVVRKDGSVGDIIVLRAPIHEIGLKQAAIDAMRRWRYRPALKAGEPVDCYFISVVDFLLEW